jgi:large subunit ribosomal protein L4
MAKTTVYDLKRKKKGDIDLPDDIFGVEINEHVLHEVVRMQLNKRRSGTASAKERNAVRGGGAKPYRQKGTGRARQGSSRAPNHVGGGVVFGPRPRDFEFRPPRSVRRKALLSALSLYVRDGRLVVLDDFSMEEPKTKSFVEVMDRFKAASGIVVDNRENLNLNLSVRNAAHFMHLPPEGLNVYDILRHDMLFLTREGLEGAVRRLRGVRRETEEGQP